MEGDTLLTFRVALISGAKSAAFLVEQAAAFKPASPRCRNRWDEWFQADRLNFYSTVVRFPIYIPITHTQEWSHHKCRDLIQATLLLETWKPDSIWHVNRKSVVHTLITGAGQAGTPSLPSKVSLQSRGKNGRGITEDTERGRGNEREGSQGKDTFTNRKWSGESPYLDHGTQTYRNERGQQKQKWSSSATSVWSAVTHWFLVVDISWPTYISNDVLSHLNMPFSDVNWQR